MSERYFGPGGPLAKRLGNAYCERPEQQRLVDEITSLKVRDRAFIHGPVATGKNDALGVAALESGRKTVLSTYTRTLLDSLAEAAEQWRADFPDKHIIVMRGRANYVCAAKLDQLRLGLDHQTRAKRKRHLAVIEHGERNVLVHAPGAPEGAGMLSQTSCPGRKTCDYAEDKRCNYYVQRDACRSADLVITTHAMVRANCMFPTRRVGVEDDDGDLTVSDEQYWFPQDQWIADEGDRLVDACVDEFEISGASIAAVMDEPLVSAEVRAQLDKLVAFAHDKCSTGYGTENLDPRKWRSFAEKTVPLLEVDAAQLLEGLDADADLPRVVLGLQRLADFLGSMLGEKAQRGYAMSVRTPAYKHDPGKRRYLSVSLRSRPISVGSAIADQVDVFERFAAVSGSIALPTESGPSFQFHEFLMRVGHNRELVLRSPIDYDAHLRVVHHPFAKQVDREQQQEQFAQLALRLHRETGNTVVLCTSYSTIKVVEQAFRDAELARELLVQRSDSGETVNVLALQLRAGKRASIVATTSGWVGLDLDARYKAAVLVEKVPVPSVTQDLCLHGRILRDGETSAYQYYATPQALKLAVQGCGRTLRREADRCLLVVCDRRFRHTDYERAIPGGQSVALDEGIAWITQQLGAPRLSSAQAVETRCSDDLDARAFLGMVETW